MGNHGKPDQQEIWPTDCHGGIENVIKRFKAELPGWWYSLGECQVSCDASCAPTSHNADLSLIPLDDRFNSGFHVDVPQPSKLSSALLIVLHDALAAKARCAGDAEEAAKMEEVAQTIMLAHGMTIEEEED